MRSKETEFAQRKWPYVIFWRCRPRMVACRRCVRAHVSYTTVALYSCRAVYRRHDPGGRRGSRLRPRSTVLAPTSVPPAARIGLNPPRMRVLAVAIIMPRYSSTRIRVSNSSIYPVRICDHNLMVFYNCPSIESQCALEQHGCLEMRRIWELIKRGRSHDVMRGSQHP